MAYIVRPNGDIHVQSPEEAVALSRLLARRASTSTAPIPRDRRPAGKKTAHTTPKKSAAPPEAPPEVEPVRNKKFRPLSGGELTKAAVADLRERVKGSSIEKLLLVLASSPDGVDDADVWRALGLSGRVAFAGVSAACKKHSVHARIGKEFIVRSRTIIGNRVGWRFALTPEFREHMEALDWTDRQERIDWRARKS